MDLNQRHSGYEPLTLPLSYTVKKRMRKDLNLRDFLRSASLAMMCDRPLCHASKMVEEVGLEPTTNRFKVCCSAN